MREVGRAGQIARLLAVVVAVVVVAAGCVRDSQDSASTAAPASATVSKSSAAGPYSAFSYEGGPADADFSRLRAHLERHGIELAGFASSLGVTSMSVRSAQLAKARSLAERFIAANRLTVRLSHPSDAHWYVIYDKGVVTKEETYIVPARTRPPTSAVGP